CLQCTTPGGAELIKIAHHYHAIQDSLPKQRDKANGSRDAQVNAGEEQRYNPPNQGEGHVDQNKYGALDRVEGVEEQNEDEKDTHRHNDAQAPHSPLLVLELATPGDKVARRKLHNGLDMLLHLFDQASHIAPADEHTYRLDALTRFPTNIHTATLNGKVCYLFQRNTQSPWRIHQDIFDA